MSTWWVWDFYGSGIWAWVIYGVCVVLSGVLALVYFYSKQDRGDVTVHHCVVTLFFGLLAFCPGLNMLIGAVMLFVIIGSSYEQIGNIVVFKKPTEELKGE